jgi:DNA end-binding protein Ku
LLELIQAKQKGKKPPVVQSAERPTNVVNLFDALKKSLAGEDSEAEAKPKSTKKQAPAKTAPKKPAAKARKSA